MHSRHRRTFSAAVALLAVAAITSPAWAQDPSGAAPASGAAPSAVTVTDAAGNEVVIDDASRVVTLGGVVTEIAYALGAQNQVVAVDQSSYYPEDALATKTVVPYYQMLTAEPVLAIEPTLVLGRATAGPPDVLTQIKDAGVTTLLVPEEISIDGATARILTIGAALGRQAEAEAVVGSLEKDLADAQGLVAKATSRPKVLFIFQPPGAPPLVSGSGTEADTMITLAGGENAVTDYANYAPLTAEAVAAAAPDIILTTTGSLQGAGGEEGMLALPGIGQTPAGQSGAIVALEDLFLLGFGPRTGQAVRELALALHPELAQ